MAKNKKVSSKNNNLQLVVKDKPKKKSTHNVWDHHDTMIVNLRQWIDRELELLESDVDKHAKSIAGKPKLVSALRKASEINTQLWDAVREVQEMASTAKDQT